mmetsp:Transcript_35711/g.76117  ORF Transcript_35711/g.76117 Transcript_35711/m.76117 type:complete len:251 (-) Transcript_35711:20-772(-)
MASLRMRGCALARDHDVLQLQITVHKALPVHVGHALEGLVEELSFHPGWQALHARHVATRARLHEQGRLITSGPTCRSVGLDHIRMVQTYRQSGRFVGLRCTLLHFDSDPGPVACELGDVDLSVGTTANIGGLLFEPGPPLHRTESVLSNHFRRFRIRCGIHFHETTASKERIVLLRIADELSEVSAESCQLCHVNRMLLLPLIQKCRRLMRAIAVASCDAKNCEKADELRHSCTTGERDMLCKQRRLCL